MSRIGQQLGRYRITEHLGQGGMSVVYKGLDTLLEREVAIKVLHPHLANNAESRKRLIREARAVARLAHPNILEVFDFASADAEEAYIVTEYIRGQTLREYFEKHPFEPPEAAALVIFQIASALAHAHEAGIIHRDLKPENIMVREDGVLKLMDFGIAKVIDRDEKMTMTGALVGSPAHMAPEIIEGEEATRASDIFSLGTMLYLFVTQHLPFSAPNTTATLRRILDGVYEDPRQKVATVSDDLAEIMARCLCRQPHDRFDSASSLRDALGDYLRGLGFQLTAAEWAAYFQSPAKFRQHCIPQMVQALLSRSERWIHEERPAKALSSLNQVLALVPDNLEAQRLLQNMNRRQVAENNARRVRKVLSVTLVSALGLAVVFLGLHWVESRQPPAEASLLREKSAPVAPAPTAPPEESKPAVVVLPEGSKEPPVKTTLTRSGGVPSVERIFNVRPWAHIQIDDLPPSTSEKARHTVRLKEGRHRIRIFCERFCLEEGSSHEIVVRADGPQSFNFLAPLKPSRVSFSGFPDDALVTVGAVVTRVKDSRQSPIEVVMPREGSTRMGHQVLFEVTKEGYRRYAGTHWVVPGSTETISGQLEQE